MLVTAPPEATAASAEAAAERWAPPREEPVSTTAKPVAEVLLEVHGMQILVAMRARTRGAVEEVRLTGGQAAAVMVDRASW